MDLHLFSNKTENTIKSVSSNNSDDDNISLSDDEISDKSNSDQTIKTIINIIESKIIKTMDEKILKFEKEFNDKLIEKINSLEKIFYENIDKKFLNLEANYQQKIGNLEINIKEDVNDKIKTELFSDLNKSKILDELKTPSINKDFIIDKFINNLEFNNIEESQSDDINYKPEILTNNEEINQTFANNFNYLPNIKTGFFKKF